MCLLSLLWSPEDVSVLGAGQAHGWSVHDGHQTLDVVLQHPVEQLLIPLLDPHDVDIPVMNQHEGKHLSLPSIPAHFLMEAPLTPKSGFQRQRKNTQVFVFGYFPSWKRGSSSSTEKVKQKYCLGHTTSAGKATHTV